MIAADAVEEQALAALIMNAVRGTMKVAAVKAPFYGEERRNLLKDLAVSVGATFFSKESGNDIKEVTLKSLGTAKTVDITNSITTIVDGNGDDELIDELIENLKEEITATEDSTRR